MLRTYLRLLTFTLALGTLLGPAQVSHAAQKATRSAVLTYEKVLEYLDLGVKEEKILAMLRESSTTFTLGKDQVAELRKAGASATLIEAMQAKATVSAGSDISAFVIILDCSGSMKDVTETGSSKWDAAREAALALIDNIPAGRELAFIVYGHDASRACKAVDVLRPMSKVTNASKNVLRKAIRALSPEGHTPIALSLQKAGLELAKTTAMSRIILITDGMETCHGDPSKEAALLLATHDHLKGGVDVIGLGLSETESAAVAKIARAGKGTYYNAKTVKQLQESVKVIEREIAQEKPDRPAVKLTALEETLVKMLKDKDRKVRLDAANTILRRKMVATVPFLIERVGDDKWEVIRGRINADESVDPSKEAALKAIKALSPEDVEEALLAGMKSKNDSVRAWAALHDLTVTTKTRAITTALIAGLSDRQRAVRQASAMSLGKRKDKVAIPALTKRVADDVWEVIRGRIDIDEKVDPSKEEALKALLAMDRDKAEDALALALKSKNAAVRAWATSKLGEVGKD